MLLETLITKNGLVGASLQLAVNKIEFAELMKYHATVETEDGPRKITHIFNAMKDGNRDNMQTVIQVVAGILQQGGLLLAIPAKSVEMFAVLNNVLGEDTDFRSITLVLRSKPRYDIPTE